MVNEITSLIRGWNAYKSDSKVLIPYNYHYATWTLGNMKYKCTSHFNFNEGMSECASGRCVGTVTLCGRCVRTSTLGNIMFGFMGNHAGIDQDSLKGAADNFKITSNVSFYDHAAYDLGFIIKNSLKGKFRWRGKNASTSVSAFCSALNTTARKNPWAFQEERAEGDYNDYSQCQPCGKTTRMTTHGGNAPKTLNPWC